MTRFGARAPRATAGVLPRRGRPRVRQAEPPASRPGAPALTPSPWTLAALGLAAALRLWNLGHGLPDFLDEAIPFRRALAMWEPGRGIDWNPHFFQYPSLTIYLHLFLQLAGFQVGRWLGQWQSPVDWHLSFQVDPTPAALVARLAQVAADLVTVAMAARLGERLRTGAGPLTALWVACSPVMIRSSRAIFTDTVMTALAIAALDRMLAWREQGGRARIAAAAVLIGLATGAKYPAVILLAPLAWVLWERKGVQGFMLLAAAAVLSLVTFFVTTPGLLFDTPSFLRDLQVVSGLATEGHLGSLGTSAFGFYLGGLVAELAWPGVALCAVALIAFVVRPETRGVAATLALALLGFAAPISIGRAEAERYLIPVLPLAAAFLGAGLLEVARRFAEPYRHAARIALITLFAIPALWRGGRAGAASPDDTQVEARRWCESHIEADALIVQEEHSGRLRSRLTRLRLLQEAQRNGASPAVRLRLEEARAFALATLPLAVSGHTRATVRQPGRDPVELELFPHAVDLNQMVYEPRLLAGVDVVVTSRAVRSRFEADTARFAAQRRFYALLDSAAEIAAHIVPRGPGTGPEITVYRLGARARSAIASLGRLDPLWWAESVPAGYRAQANRLFARSDESPALSTRGASGGASPWVRSLRPMYQERVGPFVSVLGIELERLGRCAAARELALATMEIAPRDVQACLLSSGCSGRLGVWPAARAAIERSLAAHGTAAPPVLRLHYAETLARTGEPSLAIRELERVAASSDATLAAQARSMLQSPGGPFRTVP